MAGFNVGALTDLTVPSSIDLDNVKLVFIYIIYIGHYSQESTTKSLDDVQSLSLKKWMADRSLRLQVMAGFQQGDGFQQRLRQKVFDK